MPDEGGGLPKYPTDNPYEEAISELERRSKERDANLGSRSDWLRHTWPAIAITGFALIGLVTLGAVLFSGERIIILVPGPLMIIAFVAFVFLGRRHYRNRP